MTLHPGQTKDYGKAVDALRDKAAKNVALAIQASASEQAEAELVGASDAVESDLAS